MTDAREEIIKLEEELRLAMLSSDVEKLDTLIDDSLQFIAPDGNVTTKQMDLNVHKSKIQKMYELIPSEQTVQIYDSCAVVCVKMSLVGVYGPIDISGHYRYLRVWTKIGDTWKVVVGSVVKEI